jgi:hypothetical protein
MGNQIMNSSRGFSLVEFVVAIVFVGVVIGPFLLFVARIHDLNSAIGQQARREAWHSFTDSAVTAGIDPTRAPALATTLNVGIPATSAQSVVSGNVPVVAGLPRVVPLRVVTDSTISEPRIAAGGFQLGAGPVVSPRTAPAAPLVPVVMPIPAVTPGDGSVLAVTTLSAGAPGAPYTLAIQASAAAPATVRGVLNRPAATFQGSGAAQYAVSAVDLAAGVNGNAWSEYPGNPDAGDRAVPLGDGRTRWLVTTAEHRLQIYEPSPSIHFAYTLDLGSPVLLSGAAVAANGSTVDVDYAAFYAAQSGATDWQLDFPTDVKAAFGSAWSTQAIGYQWTFGGAAGPFSGSFDTFFQPAALSQWSDWVAIQATPIVPAGATATAATWTLTRVKSVLAAPLLSTTADQAGFYAGGTIQFSAPTGPDGTTIGRLSFDGGAELSTGGTISIAVIP